MDKKKEIEIKMKKLANEIAEMQQVRGMAKIGLTKKYVSASRLIKAKKEFYKLQKQHEKL